MTRSALVREVLAVLFFSLIEPITHQLVMRVHAISNKAHGGTVSEQLPRYSQMPEQGGDLTDADTPRPEHCPAEHQRLITGNIKMETGRQSGITNITTTPDSSLPKPTGHIYDINEHPHAGARDNASPTPPIAALISRIGPPSQCEIGPKYDGLS
jgi:hypothetical protein